MIRTHTVLRLKKPPPNQLGYEGNWCPDLDSNQDILRSERSDSYRLVYRDKFEANLRFERNGADLRSRSAGRSGYSTPRGYVFLWWSGASRLARLYARIGQEMPWVNGRFIRSFTQQTQSISCSIQFWCARQDLNLHPVKDDLLKIACIPFHHER